MECACPHTGAGNARAAGLRGITTNVFPSMTLRCGAVADGSTSDNISRSIS